MQQKLPSDYLPPSDLLPELVFQIPELQYPPQLNACRELLDRNLAEKRGGRPAIFFEDRVLSYDQLSDSVQTVSAALLDLGLAPGDRVLLRFNNRPEFIVAWLAVLRIGGIVVATMPLLRSRELGAIVADCNPVFLFTQENLWEEAAPVLAQHPSCKVILCGSPKDGMSAWVDLLTHPQTCAPRDTAADDIAILAYTSGSTGEPKGTIHTHRDILAIADSYARHILSPVPEDVFTGPPTMAFTFGLGGLLVFPLRFGASTSLIERFSPTEMVQLIRDTNATLLFSSASTYNILLKEELPDLAGSCRSLRLCVSAGETLPATVFAAWKEKVGVKILDGIGSTEMLHIFISNRAGHAKPGATGTPVPGYEARIVDAELRELTCGQAGLLAVRGPTGCKYWNRPDRQREYVRGGWNIPGDIFTQDEEGVFVFQCRSDDMIVCGGYNIAGPEVESVLLEHPCVQECAVVASPDSTRGFVPKAFVVLRDGTAASPELATELQSFAKLRLAAYKYPRIVEFVSTLPKTQTGKIRRVELRNREQQTFQTLPKG